MFNLSELLKNIKLFDTPKTTPGFNPNSLPPLEMPTSTAIPLGGDRPPAPVLPPLTSPTNPTNAMPPSGWEDTVKNVGLGLNNAPTPDDAARVFAPNSLPPLGEVAPAEVPASLPAPILPSLLPSQMTQNEINDVQGKRYNKAKYDASGNLIAAAGADRDKDWTWKDKVGSALLGALEGFGQGGILGAAAGGVSAGTNRNYMEQRGDRQQLGRLLPTLNEQQGAEEAERKGRLQEAQIATIPIDDANKKLQIETQKELAAERNRGTALGQLTRKKWFDPANAADIALAKRAGVDPATLKGYDDRNPIEKMVAGQSYRLNRSTGAYEPTNLPVDESKAITEYTVKTPTGELRTYKVPQDKAAGFATQMQALGMNIEASRARQESQQTFSAGESEKQRVFQADQKEKGDKLRILLERFRANEASMRNITNIEERRRLQEDQQAAQQEMKILSDALRPQKK